MSHDLEFKFEQISLFTETNNNCIKYITTCTYIQRVQAFLHSATFDNHDR